jgi:sulfate transport system ATP-binding protein
MNEGRIEQVGSPDDVYDRPATPFVLQFLGDVNLFHGRVGHGAHSPGGAAGAPEGDVHYVRPHELDVLAQADAEAWPAELVQALTLGPVTRLEFRRDDGSYVDVELPRARWQALRDSLNLAPGQRAWLKARRVTRFVAGTDGAVVDDPAAAI